MSSTITISILDPKAIKLLKNLAELNLISIESERKNGFKKVLEKLRENSEDAPGLTEITKEVEEVRAKRYEK